MPLKKKTATAPLILTINPGSTTTKLAIYKGLKLLVDENITHPAEALKALGAIQNQIELRHQAVLVFLKAKGFSPENFDCIMARGGLLRPVAGGVYTIGPAMLEDLKSGRYGEHASNLGAPMAWALAKEDKIPAYIANPVVVDELCDLARFSGHPDIPRRTIFHALNQKAVAEELAGKLGKRVDQVNLIIAHMGGGISVGAHQKGRVVEVTNALDGEGPFTPERTGGLPILPLFKIVKERNLDAAGLKNFINRSGGLLAYLGTNDCRLIENKAVRNKKFRMAFEAMAYQVSQSIGSMAAVLEGNVDAIGLTGGLANAKPFCGWIAKRVRFIAPVHLFPKSEEMKALAQNALGVLAGRVRPKSY